MEDWTQTQCPCGTHGVPGLASAINATEHLRSLQVLVDPCHPTRKHIAIQQTHSIWITLIPPTKNLPCVANGLELRLAP